MLSLSFQRLYPVHNGLDLTSVFMEVRVCVYVCVGEGKGLNLIFYTTITASMAMQTKHMVSVNYC